MQPIELLIAESMREDLHALAQMHCPPPSPDSAHSIFVTLLADSSLTESEQEILSTLFDDALWRELLFRTVTNKTFEPVAQMFADRNRSEASANAA